MHFNEKSFRLWGRESSLSLEVCSSFSKLNTYNLEHFLVLRKTAAVSAVRSRFQHWSPEVFSSPLGQIFKNWSNIP